MQVRLVRRDDPHDQILIPDLPAVIGRHPASDVCLPDNQISQLQCMLEEHENTLRVRHICGRWNVSVNEAKVTEAFIKPGDLLKIGKHEFRVEYEAPGA